ncbi:hypothetical protein [Bacillus xiapuensis]|uniref:hypothetical protein n=1 Tax=Bacillus xiapuensis TaxID=2014075 RepID=UPI000C241B9A|nr:hypothetical protein [Bacillus xiapuensis]
MNKTWLSVLLPDDEYKERKLLFFLAESAVIMFALLFGLLCLQAGVSDWKIDSFVVLLIPFAAGLLYPTVRYILSGIEFPDVTTEAVYQKEKRQNIVRSAGFFGIFVIISFLFGIRGWDTIGVAFVSALLFYLLHYISLRRSYKENRDSL